MESVILILIACLRIRRAIFILSRFSVAGGLCGFGGQSESRRKAKSTVPPSPSQCLVLNFQWLHQGNLMAPDYRLPTGTLF